jgi:pyruvate kinase
MCAQFDNNWFKTKIIATLGPASASRERLHEMLDVGLDCCRLNFSHGQLNEHLRTLELVRAVAAERDLPICVIGDLCGPKIRLGTFSAGPVTLPVGQSVRFARGTDPCTVARLTVSYARFVDEVEVGHRIYVDDGLVRLLVTDRKEDELICTCTAGGVLNNHKGVNLPDTPLSTPALTEKDRADLDWAIEHELDYVALSFVRQPEDLYELKRLIKQRNSDVRVVIKIEKTEALEHLDELIANTDVVLVARGDLGVETDIWRVPLIQKDIVARCQAAGVPVIVATQMLQSMVASPMPTRAEVSDVANAVFDRADAVMLSAETAVGQYPVQAVDMMNRIAAAAEEYLLTRPAAESSPGVLARLRPTGAVAHAAAQAALDLGARVVAVWTATGKTVRMVAKHRLPMPVVGLTHSERVYRQINLLFGVIPIRVEPMDNPTEMAATLDARLLERRLAAAGDLVVVVTSTRPYSPGATDTTLVHRVGPPAPGP